MPIRWICKQMGNPYNLLAGCWVSQGDVSRAVSRCPIRVNRRLSAIGYRVSGVGCFGKPSPGDPTRCPQATTSD
jgi:hypothetical protein